MPVIVRELKSRARGAGVPLEPAPPGPALKKRGPPAAGFLGTRPERWIAVTVRDAAASAAPGSLARRVASLCGKLSWVAVTKRSVEKLFPGLAAWTRPKRPPPFSLRSWSCSPLDSWGGPAPGVNFDL